jgi:hypothetical protein
MVTPSCDRSSRESSTGRVESENEGGETEGWCHISEEEERRCMFHCRVRQAAGRFYSGIDGGSDLASEGG